MGLFDHFDALPDGLLSGLTRLLGRTGGQEFGNQHRLRQVSDLVE